MKQEHRTMICKAVNRLADAMNETRELVISMLSDTGETAELPMEFEMPEPVTNIPPMVRDYAALIRPRKNTKRAGYGKIPIRKAVNYLLLEFPNLTTKTFKQACDALGIETYEHANVIYFHYTNIDAVVNYLNKNNYGR